MKKIAFLLTLIMLLGMAATVSATGSQPQVESVSLAANFTYRAYSSTSYPMKVTGFLSDGTTVDLTGNAGLTYSSSSPAFVIDASGNYKTNAYGYSVLSAQYTNPDNTVVGASIYMTCYNDSTIKQSKFEGLSATESTTAVFKAPIPGHDSGEAGATKGAGYVGCGWATYSSGKRSAQGWFYDSGEKTNANATITVNVTLGLQKTIGIKDCSKDVYSISSEDTNIPRTIGWHQVAMIYHESAKTATYYIDGVEIQQVTNFTASVSSPAGGDRFYVYGDVYSGTTSYYDDIMCTTADNATNANGKYSPVNKTVTVNYDTTLGSVSYANTPVLDGSSVTVKAGSDATFTLTPSTGYQTDTVSFGGKSIGVVAGEGSAQITLDYVNINGSLNVGFKALPVAENPGFAEGSVHFIKQSDYTSDYVTEPCYSIVAYATLNNYTYTGTEKCGMIVSHNGVSTDKLEAILTVGADGAYGIRVFGGAIVAGENYVFTPYIIVDGEDVYSTPVNTEEE